MSYEYRDGRRTARYIPGRDYKRAGATHRNCPRCGLLMEFQAIAPHLKRCPGKLSPTTHDPKGA